MPDVVDLDPAGRALSALADDYADPGDETAACPSMWPLFAVPDEALSPLDREARDRHVARCARCRVTLAEALLDGAPAAPAAAIRPAPMPAATALPALPDRRRRATRVLAGLAVAAAAAASLFAIVLPMVQHAGEPTAAHVAPPAPLDVTMLDAQPPRTPLPRFDLVVVIEATERTADGQAAIDDAIARLRGYLPADSRTTIAIAHDRALDVVGKELAPGDVAAIQLPPPHAGAAPPPDYTSLLPAIGALVPDPDHRRAVLVIGTGCDRGEMSPSPSSQDELERLENRDVALMTVSIGPAMCQAVVMPRFGAGGTPVAAYVGNAVRSLVARTSAPPDPRRPLDLLVLVDGHEALLGPGSSRAFADVQRAVGAIESHVAPHSFVRIATLVGDTIHVRSSQLWNRLSLGGPLLGLPSEYVGNTVPPRHATVLDRARHILDFPHQRTTPAILLLGTGCELAPDEAAERARQIQAAIAAGIAVTAVEYRPAALAGCARFWDPADPALRLRDARIPSSLPGLVADALDDISRPSAPIATAPPASLLHFVHDTLGAP